MRRANLQFPWSEALGDGSDQPIDREGLLETSFTPSAPVSERDLFAGRGRQLKSVLDAIGRTGQHVIVYGERGVGKTSLALVLREILAADDAESLAAYVSCTIGDSFDSIWRNVLKQVPLRRDVPQTGFVRSSQTFDGTLAERVPDAAMTATTVREWLQLVGDARRTVVIVDEFDRLEQREVTTQFADTIKTLSDHRVSATVILLGVADSIETLIEEHASVDRALVQVRMPRMSDGELELILRRGLRRAQMAIAPAAVHTIVRLSQGLPNYTHELALLAGRQALSYLRTNVTDDDVDAAIEGAVSAREASVSSSHAGAISSPQRGHLYEKVLLACALAPLDDRGFFAPGDVRRPLERMTGRTFRVDAYTRHLSEFCENKRGRVLQREGTTRRFRFRFADPVMQPYVIMRGLARGVIDRRVALGD